MSKKNTSAMDEQHKRGDEDRTLHEGDDGENAARARAADAAFADAGESHHDTQQDSEERPSDPKETIDRLEAELQQAQRRELMAQAELENFRKRMRREMDDERRYAALPLIRDLLPALDNLKRAIQSAEQGSEGAGLLDGVKMVARQIEEALAQHNCHSIEAEGAEFDPNVHEALAQQPSEKHEAGTVMLVTQSGYKLHDRVVRPAQVFVSTGKAEPS